MRSSKYLFSTIKKNNTKKENTFELIKRLGIFKKLCSGLYTLMPTGKKIINKINNIIRYEMNNIYSMEISMPILQPIKLLIKSKRIKLFGEELLKIKNNNNSFILSPTNEEEISYIMKNEIFSKKQLPIILFQIKTKFRNEIRPRCNIIRTKEFIMKDAYSFNYNYNSLNKTYNKVKKVYKNIFRKLNINNYIVKADPGFIKGDESHEFHVVSEYGDNKIIICNKTNDVEIFKNSKKIYINNRLTPKENLNYIKYDDNIYRKKLIKDINFKNKLIKIIILHSNKKLTKSNFLALIIKFNDEICKEKIKNIYKIKYPIKYANKNDIYNIFKFNINNIGIFDIKKIPILLDYNVALMSDFISISNKDKKIISGINWDKNIDLNYEIVDISTNSSNKNLTIKKSIEIAHIFKLNNVYTNNEKFLINKKIFMGCYGIGISRILFLLIEKNIKNNDLILPYNISPFTICIIPVDYKNSKNVKKISEIIYFKLKKKNIDVILEDRINKTFGYVINDMSLIGIPIFIIINKNDIKVNIVEIINRFEKRIFKLNVNKILKYLKKIL